MADPQQKTPVGDYEVRDVQTGQVARVDGSTALREYAAGRVQLRPGQKITIRDADGALVEMDPSKQDGAYLDAITAGVETPSTPTQGEVQEERLEEQYGGIGGQILAGGAALARGATLGLSDVAVQGVAGVAGALQGRSFGQAFAEAGQELENLKAANPTTSLVGEGVGMVAPIVASGGTGLAARVASKAPAAMLERAGAGAAAKFGGKAAGLVAQGVVEGTVGNAAMTVTDASRQGRLPSAKELVVSMSTGGVLGGGANLVLGKMAGALARRGDDALARAVPVETRDTLARAVPVETRDAVKTITGVTDNSVADNAARKLAAYEQVENKMRDVSKVARRVHGEEAAAHIDELVESSDARRIVFDTDSYVDDQARKFKAAMDELEDGSADILDDFVAKQKPKAVLRNMAEDVPQEMFDAQLGAVRAARELAEQYQESPGVFWRSTKSGRELLKVADAYESLLLNAPAGRGWTRETAADAYVLMDNFKRQVGRLTQSAQRSGASEVTRDLKDLYQGVRGLLEDERFGDIALGQRTVNEYWSELIANDKVLDRKLLTRSGKSRNFVDQYETSPEFARRIIREPAVDDSLNLEARQLARKLDMLPSVLSAMDQIGTLTVQQREFVRRAPELADEIRKILADADAAQALRKKHEILSKQIAASDIKGKMSGLGLAATVAGAATGGLAGAGVVGGVAAAAKLLTRNAAEAATRPLDVIESLHRASGGIQDDKIIGGVAPSLVSKVAAKIRIDKALGKAVSGLLSGKATRYAAVQFSAKAYQETVAQITQPEEEEPVDELAAARAEILGYLRDKLPASTVVALEAEVPVDGIPLPSPNEGRTFMQTVQAATDPLTIFAEMAKGGTVAPAALQTLREVHPELWQQARDKAIEVAGAKGRKLTPAQRRMLAMTFDVDAGPSANPRFFAALHAGAAATQAPAPQAPVTPQTAARPARVDLKTTTSTARTAADSLAARSARRLS